jgi:hypothetical protein
MSLANFSQISLKYSCDCCEIFTNNKKDYNNHLLTAKHKKNMSFNNISPNVPAFSQNLEPQIASIVFQATNTYTNNDNKTNHICEKCNKIYKSRVGLWYHGKKCEIKIAEKIPELDSDLKTDLLKKDNLIEYLIKENQEFKSLIMDLIKKDHNTNITNNNNNSNNINNINNSFNLNLFLNEKCKDAININDFVDNVKMQLSDLENFGHMGYVEGVSQILIKNLNDLDTYSRPIHCSDLKREVMYIKNNDQWTKETDDKPVFKNAIKQVANKNIKQIQTWKNEHPGCTNSDSRKNDQYINIVMNSMSGGSNEEQQNNISQIVKNVSKAVVIDKNIEK